MSAYGHWFANSFVSKWASLKFQSKKEALSDLAVCFILYKLLLLVIGGRKVGGS